jgi:hypothetical protein
MTIIRKQFGYSKVKTDNKEEIKILFAYCEAKSRIWQMFLGWREANKEVYFFWIPTKAIKELEDILKVF